MAIPVATVAFVGLSVLAIFNKWAVLFFTIVVAVVGLAVWTWRHGFRAFEIVAFLIHFDGLEYSIISIGRIASVVVTLILIRRIVVERWRPPAVPFWNWAPIWLVFGWFAVGGMWSSSAGDWLKAFLMLYLGIVFFCVTAMLVESHKDVQRFLRAFWVGGLFGSAAGILALFLRTRSEGLIGDPNFFGLVQAAMVPLTVYYYRNTTNRGERTMYLVALVVVLGGAAGAGSRSGLIGGAAAIVLTMVTKPGIGTGKRLRIGLIAMIVAPIAFLIGFVANPANLERGFSDRGAGRLDFWTTTQEIIRDRPLFGQGPGQTAIEIPQRQLITPGVENINEKRTAVSSHNTWLDLFADSGLVGLSLYGLSFAVAIVSLMRPRWPYMSDLSTTVLVMFAPVFTASFFLPLLNNKMAWSLAGLAASLAVSSKTARWPDRVVKEPEQDSRLAHVDLALPRATAADLVPYAGSSGPPAVMRPQELLASPLRIDEMPDVELAKWDFRITRHMWRRAFAAAVIGAIVIFAIGTQLSHRYTATTVLIAPAVSGSFPDDELVLKIEASQRVLALVKSELYASNLIEASGIDRSVAEVLDSIDVTKPGMGGMVQIAFTDSDQAVVERAAPHLIEALAAIYDSTRDFAAGSVNDQVRPMNPGEQNYYAGPPVSALLADPVMTDHAPRKVWMALTGGLAAAILTMGFSLFGARHPRVSDDDDIEAMTGLPVVGHVAVGGREPIESLVGQVNQLAVTITDRVSSTAPLRRIVVSPTTRGDLAEQLTVDLVSALISQGDRVVLVDADVERMGMASKLDPSGTSPGARDPLDLHTVDFEALSAPSRLLMTGLMGELRLLRGTQLVDSRDDSIDPLRLAELDDTVTIVVLAPPATSAVGVAELMRWSQMVLVPMRVGVTRTTDASRAASRVDLLGATRGGAVLINS